MFRGKLDLYFHNLVELELTYLWSIIIEWSCFGSFDKDEPVPECISLYLKRCCLKGYIGSIDETVFARYIMQNAKYLRTMKICTDGDATPDMKYSMIRVLSSFEKSSDSCTLSFE